jgi:hypothetical protein
MSPIKPRRFTLVDAIVLIAAMAVALVPIRYFLTPDLLEARPTSWSLSSIWEFTLGWHWIATPFLVTWSLAVWVLRFRQPRPRLRRLFRQPGMAATTAILFSFALTGTKLFGLFGIHFLANSSGLADWHNLAPELFFMYSMRYLNVLCDAVLSVWMLLWLAGAWRSEASWVDRFGRGLGVFGAVYGSVFNCFAYAF